MLDLGQNLGQLTLSLRNPEDDVEAATRPATLADIRFRQEKPVERPKEGESPLPGVFQTKQTPEVFQILTLRGSHRGRVQVAAGG